VRRFVAPLVVVLALALVLGGCVTRRETDVRVVPVVMEQSAPGPQKDYPTQTCDEWWEQHGGRERRLTTPHPAGC